MVSHWLHPAWLSWPVSAERLSLSPLNKHARPYDLWNHANSLLEKDQDTRQIRADALINLRRSIDLRIQTIIDKFQLKDVPIRTKPTGHLDLLQYFGVVRPMMAEKLIAIRNSVEHQDAIPPAEDEMRELAEFTWYFLRSTDDILRRMPSGLTFDSAYMDSKKRDEYTIPPYRLVVDVGPNAKSGWAAWTHGYVPASLLKTSPTDDYVALDLDSVETRKERRERQDPEWWDRHSQVASEDDLFIIGRIRGNSEHIRTLVNRFLFL
jgi:hypothetical protein